MRNNQRGQVLLIIILLSTVLLTVALSVSQITTEETKISKLEEESKKAFAAAEAGIEAQIKAPAGTTTNIVTGLKIAGIAQGLASTATLTDTFFYINKINKDDQFTFYLSDYTRNSNSFSNPFTGNLTFYFVTNGATCTGNPANVPTFELTLVSNDPSPVVSRKIIDPCSALTASSPSHDIIQTQANSTPVTVPRDTSGRTFTYQTTTPLAIGGNINIMLIRALFPASSSATTVELTVAGTDSVGDPTNLKPQGQTVTSNATTTTGVAKKVQLFQSYPQLPADLFVTSF